MMLTLLHNLFMNSMSSSLSLWPLGAMKYRQACTLAMMIAMLAGEDDDGDDDVDDDVAFNQQ